jgi:cytochrome P450
MEATVFVARPDAVRQVFALGPEEVRLPAEGEFMALVGPSSLFMTHGAEHQWQRRMVLPAFHGERVAQWGRSIFDQCDAALDEWPLEQPLSLERLLHGLILRCTMTVLFGDEREAGRLNLIGRYYEQALRSISSPLMLLPVAWQRIFLGPLSPWARTLRIRDRVDEILYSELPRRRSAGAPSNDVLSLLVQARDGQGKMLTDRELRDHVFTLLTAGPDTVSIATSWAVDELLANPDVLARVRAAVAAEMESGDAAELPERLCRCALLDAAVRETLRLHPVFPQTTRILLRPLRLGGYELPAGTRVAPCAHLVHRSPSIYREPAAERFVPERFLGGLPDKSEYFPFGGGVHRCVGVELALLQMKIVLGILLIRTELGRASGPPTRGALRFFSIAPAGGRPVILRSREAPLRARTSDAPSRSGSNTRLRSVH